MSNNQSATDAEVMEAAERNSIRWDAALQLLANAEASEREA